MTARHGPARLLVPTSLLVGGILAGCSSAPQTPPDPFPERPFAVDVAALDPCTTLTDEQVRGLGDGVTRSSGEPNVGGRPSRACGWLPAGGEYPGSVQTLGFDAAESIGAPGTTLDSVSGFGALRVVETEPSPTCDLILDVADGASIRVTVQSFRREPDGGRTPPDLVCEQTRRLAEQVVDTLRARSG